MTDRTLPFWWTVSRGYAAAFLVVFLAVSSAAAEPFGTPSPFAVLVGGVGTAPDVLPRRSPQTQQVLGTATLVLTGDAAAAPLTALALLQGGDAIGCWTLINTDRARPIPSQFLKTFANKPAPLPTLTNNGPEYDALSYVLVLAAKNTPAAFRASASANERVSYAMLFQQPGVHRGEPIHVEGQAQWVNKLDTPPLFAELKAPLDNLYEVWIVNPVVSATPYSVLLTQLPPGLPVGQPLNVPVELDGYFLKRRLEPENAVHRKAWQSSLLIAGHSLTVQKPAAVTVTAPGRATVGAATLVLSGTAPHSAPLAELALLRNGERAGCWTLVDSDVVRPLAAATLAQIKDGPTLPDDASSGMEFDALREVLVQVWTTAPAAFTKAARSDLSFAQLFQHPDKYRGDVVHIEGRLRLLQRWEPPTMAREAGVPLMYEATIFDTASGGNPYIVLLMDEPVGIPLNKKVNETVAFDGYFYKKWTYKALDTAETKKDRAAPLLIGRSLKVLSSGANAPAAPEVAEGWLVPAVAIGVAVLTVGVGVMFFLAFWMRRADARIHDKLHAVRTKTFVLPTADEPPRKDPGA